MARPDSYYMPAVPMDEGIGVKVTLINKKEETTLVSNEAAKLVLAMLPSKLVRIKKMEVSEGNLNLTIYADFVLNPTGMVQVTLTPVAQEEEGTEYETRMVDGEEQVWKKRPGQDEWERCTACEEANRKEK